jgi:hypothetical protein
MVPVGETMNCSRAQPHIDPKAIDVRIQGTYVHKLSFVPIRLCLRRAVRVLKMNKSCQFFRSASHSFVLE